jgi:hypothetical protein
MSGNNHINFQPLSKIILKKMTENRRETTEDRKQMAEGTKKSAER